MQHGNRPEHSFPYPTINAPPDVPQTGLHPGVEVHLGDTTLLGQCEYM
jgi:hypothetical protein